jgi:hypothetical protein
MPHKEEMVHSPWREQESGLRGWAFRISECRLREKRGQGAGKKQFAVDGWQFTGKTGSDARCRIQDAGASRQFPALHYSNIFA